MTAHVPSRRVCSIPSRQTLADAALGLRFACPGEEVDHREHDRAGGGEVATCRCKQGVELGVVGQPGLYDLGAGVVDEVGDDGPLWVPGWAHLGAGLDANVGEAGASKQLGQSAADVGVGSSAAGHGCEQVGEPLPGGMGWVAQTEKVDL